MSKVAEVQNQEQAYNQASQFYWEKLYRAVRQALEDYNAGKPALLSVGELGEGLNAREFTVEHSRTDLSTQVIRNTESWPHTIDIICHVIGTHRVELRLTGGLIDTFRTFVPKEGTSNVKQLDAPARLMLDEIVRLIVKPLKELDVCRAI